MQLNFIYWTQYNGQYVKHRFPPKCHGYSLPAEYMEWFTWLLYIGHSLMDCMSYIDFHLSDRGIPASRVYGEIHLNFIYWTQYNGQYVIHRFPSIWHGYSLPGEYLVWFTWILYIGHSIMDSMSYIDFHLFDTGIPCQESIWCDSPEFYILDTV